MKAAGGPLQSELDRLTGDLRTFDVNGIERAAWGWDDHSSRGLAGYHRAEKAALEHIETAERGEAWEDFRRKVFGLTEAENALVSWKARHGEIGHKAERAAFGAALGIFARDGISHDDYERLVSAMAEALPWLLPERPATRR
jgi:hypothetical protein